MNIPPPDCVLSGLSLGTNIVIDHTAGRAFHSLVDLLATKRRAPSMGQVTMAPSLATFDLRVWMHSFMSIILASAQGTRSLQHISKYAQSSRQRRSSIVCSWHRNCAQAPTRTALLQVQIQLLNPDRQRLKILSGPQSSVKMADTLLQVVKTESFAYGRCCRVRKSEERTRKTKAILQARRRISVHRSSNKSHIASMTVTQRRSLI